MFINFWDCSVFPIFFHDSSFWRHFCGKREGSNSFSCIDLIFCNKQNLISNYGVDLSIFEKCHHNIIFGKINIHILLSPTYVCEVWNYSKTNIKNMQKAILIFDWKKAFENFSVDEKVKLLNDTLLNIFRNYIPNKKIKFNHCQPPSMIDKLKRCLKERIN